VERLAWQLLGNPRRWRSFLVNWRERIVVDPKILAGKPIIKGTWLSVESIIGLLVSGCSPEQVLRDHEDLTADDVKACVGCARELLATAA
jgi:uncharacterized protein (DUF433 family)